MCGLWRMESGDKLNGRSKIVGGTWTRGIIAVLGREKLSVDAMVALGFHHVCEERETLGPKKFWIRRRIDLRGRFGQHF